MKKYFVIAKHWDNEKEDVVKYIAGEFTNWANAAIFCKAYSEHYSAKAEIVEAHDLVNA